MVLEDAGAYGRGRVVEADDPRNIRLVGQSGDDPLANSPGIACDGYGSHGAYDAPVSIPGPSEGDGSNPFEPLFNELAKMFAAQGPVNWQLAKHFATQLAGGSEANVDPLQRIALEDLVRVADMHVAEATGLPTSTSGRPPAIRVVTRGEWAGRTLDDWRPLFEGMAGSLGKIASTPEDADESTADLIGGLTQFIGPMLLGMQAGSMVGHLAQTALGQYHFPIPRPKADELLVVVANTDAIADEANLERNDVRMWVLLSELTHHAVISRPHVHRRLSELFADYVAMFEPDVAGLEARLGEIDPMNPSSFEEVLGDDPAQLISSLRSPAQQMLMNQIAALVAVLEGYVDHVVDSVGRRLIGPGARVSEVVRTRRAEQHAADPIAEALFGLDLAPALFERGSRFVNGVVERVGEEGLTRLWKSDLELPTPAEVDAPGLWWERINLPLDSDFPDFPDSPDGLR